ncbi:MAG TPA: UbiA family prenyltransferase [Terriglobia bacterium]|nr:UbiA family prenyltransferase [Terriglobia bacterium]
MSTKAISSQPRWRIYLRLGRVSNLPTIWTNCLAGTVLAGAVPGVTTLFLTALSISLMYVAGMFLNDAFDQQFDCEFRPERPIPSGQIAAKTVFTIGFGLMFSGVALLVASAALLCQIRLEAVFWAVALCGLIVYYDWHHKEDPMSPVIMGLCRVLVYFSAAAIAGTSLIRPVIAGGAVLLCYMIGLTYIAKQENLREIKNLWPILFLAAPFVYCADTLLKGDWRVLSYMALLLWVLYSVRFLLRPRKNIPRAVVNLIAGISLVDGLLIVSVSSVNAYGWAGLVGLMLTLFFQRYVAGT